MAVLCTRRDGRNSMLNVALYHQSGSITVAMQRQTELVGWLSQRAEFIGGERVSWSVIDH